LNRYSIDDYGLNDWGSILGRGKEGIFLLVATACRSALGPTQPPIQCVLVVVSPGVKRPDRKADHSSPSVAEVKNVWSYTSTSPNTSSWRGA